MRKPDVVLSIHKDTLNIIPCQPILLSDVGEFVPVIPGNPNPWRGEPEISRPILRNAMDNVTDQTVIHREVLESLTLEDLCVSLLFLVAEALLILKICLLLRIPLFLFWKIFDR